MAKYNEINVGRWNRFLTKLTGIKGPAPAPQLATEVQVVHPIFHGPENRYLEGWEKFAIEFAVTAGGVGNFGQAQIRNPANSNVIAVLEKYTIINNVADSPIVQFGQPNLDLLTAQQSNVRAFDTRGRPTSTLIATSGTPAGQGQIGSNIWIANTSPTNTTLDMVLFEEQEIPILPNSTVRAISGTANQTFVCVMWWRERFLEEGERT